MNVVLEKPITWLASERDGERNRFMYARVRDVLSDAKVRLLEEETHYGSDFCPRSAPKNGIRISYHSIGEAENVWRIKETSIPYFYAIDRLGYSGWSELAIRAEQHRGRIECLDPERSRVFCEDLTSWLVSNNLSKYRQTPIRASLPDQYFFFPLQVLHDQVARHYRVHPVRILLRAARAARRHNRYLVIKRHPYCSSRLMNWCIHLVTSLYHNVICTEASVTQALPSCTAVITGNSGVGLEALAYGKPVFTFGTSEYMIASYQLDRPRDVDAIFAQANYPEHPLARRFIYYYLNHMCFDVRVSSDVRNKLTALLQPNAWHKC